MMPQALINELTNLDYVLSLDGDRVRFAFRGNGDPPVERAAPLLIRLREKKGEVVAFLRRAEGVDRWGGLHEALICGACGSRTFWISIHGATVCPVCHPPAHESLVRTWVGRTSDSRRAKP